MTKGNKVLALLLRVGLMQVRILVTAEKKCLEHTKAPCTLFSALCSPAHRWKTSAVKLNRG